MKHEHFNLVGSPGVLDFKLPTQTRNVSLVTYLLYKTLNYISHMSLCRSDWRKFNYTAGNWLIECPRKFFGTWKKSDHLFPSWTLHSLPVYLNRHVVHRQGSSLRTGVLSENGTRERERQRQRERRQKERERERRWKIGREPLKITASVTVGRVAGCWMSGLYTGTRNA